jgi:C-terminal processing protease CtpA/Prc
MKGLAAEKAGVKVGDIIVDLGGYTVDSVTSLTRILRRFEPGQTVSLTVVRNGQKVYLAITLGERPEQESSANQNNNAGNSGSSSDSFGQWFENWKDYLSPFFGIG